MSNPFDQFDDAPAGVRNNNPLNLTGSGWSGQTGSEGKFAQFNTPEEGRSAADVNLQAYYRKHGLNTVAGVVGRWAPPNENDTPSYVKAVSGKLDVQPNDPLDMEDPTVRGRLLDAMQEHETGQPAASNPFDQFDGSTASATKPAPAKPKAPVVVLNAETGQPYSDAQELAYGSLIKAGKIDRNSQPGSQSFPRGLASASDTPKPGEWYVDLDGNLKQAPASVLADAGSGFAQPFVNLGHDVAESYRRTTAEAKAPPTSLGEAASQAGQGLMDIPRLAGDALGLASAPVQAVVHPLAGVISRALPPPKATHTEWRGLIPHTYVDGDMSPQNAQATVENAINMALQGARPTGVTLPTARSASAQVGAVPGKNLTQQVRAVAPQMPVKLPPEKTIGDTVSRLLTDKRALYKNVDSSGFTFSKADISQLASDLEAQVRAKGGPKAAKASPQADSMLGRLKALAGQPGGVTLSQLDNLRSDVWPLLMEAGGSDAVYGGIIRKGIDELIGKAQAPHIAEARAANMRWAKADEVARRVRSAELQAGRANSGENLGNAIRQKLSPMIDPMHSGQVQNLTGSEADALERVVVGDKTQNGLRTWGNRLRNPIWTGAATTPATLLGLAGAGPLGGATAAGLTAAGMQAAGQALRSAAEARTMRNVDKLIEQIAGARPAANDLAVTPRGLLGAAVVSAPAVRRPAPSKKKARSK